MFLLFFSTRSFAIEHLLGRQHCCLAKKKFTFRFKIKIFIYNFQLLSSLATDLDLMLNDLRSTPPRFIQPRTSISIVSHLG